MNATTPAPAVSLGEFLTHLIVNLDEKRTPMPFQNEEKWHRLFYGLKTSSAAQGKPDFLNSMRFDWDGPYPKSKDLSDYLHALHLNCFVSVANPSYDNLTLDKDVRSQMTGKSQTISKDLGDFLQSSTEEAARLFGS